MRWGKDAGSRYEAADKQGISHFVQHMLFKGTGTRTARDISEEMDRLGGGLTAFAEKGGIRRANVLY